MIDSISKKEFQKTMHTLRVLEKTAVREVAWFANSPRTLMGTIARREVATDWTFAIVARTKAGEYQISEVQGGFFNLEGARRAILLEMAAVAKSPHSKFSGPL